MGRRLRADLLGFLLSAALLVLLVLLPSLLLPGSLLWAGSLLRLLTSWRGLAVLLVAIVGLPVGIWQLLSEVRYWRICRRAVAEGLDFPVPPQRAARRRGWANLIFALLSLVFLLVTLLSLFPSGPEWYHPQNWEELLEKPIVLSQDLGLSEEVLDLRLEEHATPFFHTYALKEYVGTGFYTDVYVAAARPLARLALAAELEQLEGRERPILLHPVDLGFDESYLHRQTDGDGSYHILLLRQGNTTARFSGRFDWTDPDIRHVLWERLQLKE